MPVVLLSSKLWPSDGPFAEQNILNLKTSFLYSFIDLFTIISFHTKILISFNGVNKNGAQEGGIILLFYKKLITISKTNNVSDQGI